MPKDKDNLFWEALIGHKISKKMLKKAKKNKLANAKQLSLKYEVTPFEVEKVYTIFQLMDNDGSGTISAGEIANMLQDLGIEVSPKVVQAVMRQSDKSGDGEIDFEEFLASVADKARSMCDANSSTHSTANGIVAVDAAHVDDAVHVDVQFDRHQQKKVEEHVIPCKQTWITTVIVKDVENSPETATPMLHEFITLCQTV